MCAYTEPTISTHMSGWTLLTRPIRTDHMYCGRIVTIDYPDSVVAFGNNTVINPWLGMGYLLIITVLVIIIPITSLIKKLKRGLLIAYASMFTGLFILSYIVSGTPYGHFTMWTSWALLILDSIMLVFGIVLGIMLINKRLRKRLLV